MPNPTTSNVEPGAWLTTEKVAADLACTERHVLNLIHRGDLKAYKFGRLYRIHPRDLERALKPVAAGAHGGAA